MGKREVVGVGTRGEGKHSRASRFDLKKIMS